MGSAFSCLRLPKSAQVRVVGRRVGLLSLAAGRPRTVHKHLLRRIDLGVHALQLEAEFRHLRLALERRSEAQLVLVLETLT